MIVATRTRSRASLAIYDPALKPDGGPEAWLQVASCWCVVFCTFGLVNTFGVYQTYYEQVLLTTESSSNISWIGSLQGCLLLAGGLISGPVYDMGYFRELIWGGLTFIIFGQFMTSLCSTYWQVFLAQGLCIGIGCGMIFLPATAVLSQYFSKRIALATGLGSSGSPVAGTVLPIVFNQLVNKIGFGWATRVIAFILLALASVPLLFFRTRLPPSKKRRALVDLAALREPPFVTFILGGFFSFMGLYIAFFYIELFTVEHGLASPEFSPYMVTLMNAASVLGRIVPGLVADYTGHPCLVMAACALASCFLDFAWLGTRNFPGITVFAVLYGAFSGGVVSSQPTSVFQLTRDPRQVGTRLGMSCFVAGMALLVGTPVGGAILGSSSASEARWMGLIGFAAAVFLLGGSLILSTGLILVMRARRKLRG